MDTPKKDLDYDENITYDDLTQDQIGILLGKCTDIISKGVNTKLSPEETKFLNWANKVVQHPKK